MKKVERKLKLCIFCFKSVEEFISSKEQNDIHHFFTMLERHLEADLSFKDGDDGESSRNGIWLREIFNGRSCEDCNKIVSSFCDLYCQIKRLELKINWRMTSLINIMSSADKVASRVERFRSSFTRKDGDKEGRNSFENVWTSRKILIDNCARKVRRSYPKLVITKCGKNQHRLLPSSLPVSIPNETSQLSLEINSSSSVPISTLSLEPISIASAEDYVECSKMDIETTPVQINSSSRHTKLLRRENKMNELNFICSNCPRIFSTRVELKFHQNSHLKWNKIQEFRIAENHSADEPSIFFQDGDAKHPDNSSSNNPKEKELFLKHSFEQLESEGDNVPTEDLELSNCKFSLRKDNNKISNFSCSQCSRIFPTQIQLNFHQYSHLKLDTRYETNKIVENNVNPSQQLNTIVISEPAINRPDADVETIDNKNSRISNLKNSIDPVSSLEHILFLEKTMPEVEADVNAVPMVDLELSYCKLDVFNSPTSSIDDIDDPSPWEAVTEPTIENTTVILGEVADTKQECSADTNLLALLPSEKTETPCVINNILARDPPPSSSLLTKSTNQSCETSSLENTSPEETSVSHRLRTVYKCNLCCKTFSNQDKQLVHEKSHLQLETEGDDNMSTNSDEDKSEDDFDPGCEKDSDSSSSINGHQDDEEDGGSKDVVVNVVDTKYECSTSPNDYADVNDSPSVKIDAEDSPPREIKVGEIAGTDVNKPMSLENCLVKKTFSSKKRKRFQAVFIPPPKVTTERGSSKFECGCRKLFDSIGAYRSHRILVHKTDKMSKYKAENSDVWVPPKTIMELELLIPKYSCCEAKCSKMFVMEEELENHKKQHGTFQCQGCPVVKHFAPNLSIHEAKHSSKNTTGEASGNKLWNCFRCDFSCKTQSSYVCHHMKKHLQVPTTIYMCPICRKSFHGFGARVRRQRNLNVHFKICHDVSGMKPESVPKCSQCSAYFRTVRQLQSHKNTLCKHRCFDCGKMFNIKAYLLSHRLKYHINIGTPLPHKCKEESCGKAFETKDDLELHTMKYHPPGKSSLVKCTICGKEVFQVNISIHVYAAHTKAKSEKAAKICEKCGKSFVDSVQLRAHLLSHAGPQNWKFSCSICGRKCSTKTKLKDHERTHKKEKPFVCQVCGVSYAHRHNLRIHINNKHSDVIQDISKPRDKMNATSRKGMKCKAVFDKVSDTIEDDFSD